MTDSKDEINVVELLREKKEETDLKLCLKSTLGGFTKKSVIAYLTLLREQQQAAAATFEQNLQAVFSEKAKLKTENEGLKEKLLKMESEYKNISQSMLIHDLEKPGYQPEDIDNFKGSIAALENEVRRINHINHELEDRNEQLTEAMAALEESLAKSRQETEAQKGLLALEKNESKKERDEIIQLLTTVEEQRDEIKCLRELLSENKIAQITTAISELKAQVNADADRMANYREDLLAKEQMITSLAEENQSLKQKASALGDLLEKSSMQNDKLSLANQALSDKLNEEYRKAIAMINEKSDIVMEKLLALKKLDEANSKIIMLELELERDAMRNEKKQINQKNHEIIEASV